MLPVSDILCSILSFILSNNLWSRSPVGFDAPSLPERVMVLVSTFRFFSLLPFLSALKNMVFFRLYI